MTKSVSVRTGHAQRVGSSMVLAIFFVVFCAIFGTRIYREWHAASNSAPKRIAICIGAICMFAFAEPMWIGLVPPAMLEHVELPNAPGGDRVTAPDGRVFVVSYPIARVQRYGPGGFEMGFMYGAKASSAGMSSSGAILICTVSHALLSYSADGIELPPRGSCPDRAKTWSFYLGHAQVPSIAFSWIALLAVPFWHPLAAWSIAVLTGLLAWSIEREAVR
ncbi:hypothetical protein [Bradyrhizobium sp. SRS-191]|uniref:hypothetical protein n=1 Tax=Bradyrhizobium sp. SRS-191 TaxID=2962606 RepID=UPI00211DEED3|nr:hypothetical protein [Bradyrhizobium sp. SRS-191]